MRYSESGDVRQPAILHADEITRIVFLTLPPSQVVLLQAYFDLSEGLGVVRTLQKERSLVCVMTTSSGIGDCVKLLSSLQQNLHLRFAEIPDESVLKMTGIRAALG